MQALSIPRDSVDAPAQAERNPGDTRTAEEEVSRAEFDAVFEFACRLIIIESLPGWIEEVCTEHFGSIHAATGTHNADAAVWKKAQAALNLRDQASDQKIDV
jgi:hypothetical protein